MYLSNKIARKCLKTFFLLARSTRPFSSCDYAVVSSLCGPINLINLFENELFVGDRYHLI